MTVATAKQYTPKWGVIIFLSVIHLAVPFAFLPAFFNWSAVGVALLLHWVTGGLGITLGFHRLLTHRSFATPKWLEYFFILCGTLALEGTVIQWVGNHRMHHKYSDAGADDPHDSNRGFWWSHMGWLLCEPVDNEEVHKYTKDIADDRFYQFCGNYALALQIALGVLLYALGGWPFVFWGVFVRLVLVYHCTWFVNSATHQFGYVSHESNDNSKNCWWVALLTYGEGWHNNHHAYQYSARHGMRWWEIDATWMTIWLLQRLGLATKVRLLE